MLKVIVNESKREGIHEIHDANPVARKRVN